MDDFLDRPHKEKLFILTKTYPIPSMHYREHTCVVAINERRQLRRLYPIPYRCMDQKYQFSRWQWISATIERASSDRRPESHRPNLDTIKLLDKITTRNNWDQRLEWFMGQIVDSPALLEDRRLMSGQSIGIVKPLDYALEIEPEEDPDWTPKEKADLEKSGLFDSPGVAHRPILRKVPYKFYYRYHCRNADGNITEHRNLITDWEIGMLFWNCFDAAPENWQKPFQEKMKFIGRNLLFIMGTVHRFPDQWLIVGVIYPPQVDAHQFSLWPCI